MTSTPRGLLIGVVLLTAGASSALAQDAGLEEPAPLDGVGALVREGREAARRGDYEEATEALTRASELSPEPSSLEIELALSAWQAGHDARAVDLLSRSSSDDGRVLATALRLDVDPALVLAQPPGARRHARLELDLARTELDVAEGLYWSSALGGTASFAVAVIAPGSGACTVSCQDYAYASAAVASASLALLVAGLGVSIDGFARRGRWESSLRADASGLRLTF